MKTHAITFDKPGTPEVLTWTEIAAPIPAPDEVMIDVQAAGINNADLLAFVQSGPNGQREGAVETVAART